MTFHQSAELKQLRNYTKEKKFDKKTGEPIFNWWFVINDAEGNEYQGYSNEDNQQTADRHKANEYKNTYVNVAGDPYEKDGKNMLKRSVLTLIGSQPSPEEESGPNSESKQVEELDEGFDPVKLEKEFQKELEAKENADEMNRQWSNMGTEGHPTPESKTNNKNKPTNVYETKANDMQMAFAACVEKPFFKFFANKPDAQERLVVTVFLSNR